MCESDKSLHTSSQNFNFVKVKESSQAYCTLPFFYLFYAALSTSPNGSLFSKEIIKRIQSLDPLVSNTLLGQSRLLTYSANYLKGQYLAYKNRELFFRSGNLY
jgi:hypothetical protein